ncbi:Aspartyl/glutamyl-tRNA(Asn/Gln) amidotransferase subunit C OS=Streptomyces tendae OX=1932 GN=gatC PE=3 SV=1 [Streptomyces tendae]
MTDQDVADLAPAPLTNVSAADEVRPSLTPEQALSGARPRSGGVLQGAPEWLGED